MFSISNELKILADDVIEEHANLAHLKSGDIMIVYMYSDQEKKKNGGLVYADTQLVNPKMKALASCDFIITFYKPNSDMLSPDQLKILMYHELRHVGYDPAKNKHYIIPHDVEDFKDIISEHGVDWTAEF